MVSRFAGGCWGIAACWRGYAMFEAALGCGYAGYCMFEESCWGSTA